jgi:CRP-like cAMP-binding protein
MTSLAQTDCGNLLLRCLGEEDFARIAPHLTRTRLKIGQVITPAGEPFETACFPDLGGIITFSDVMADQSRIGVGHVGYEGFAGWPVILGCHHSSHAVEVTAEGEAVKIAVSDLRNACAQSELLRGLLLRFVQVFFVQLSRTIVSSLIHPVATRLCRWTLMAQDRIGSDEIKVTHDVLALMLATRRASVTDALHILEGEGLIRSCRGRIVVLDREGLRRQAGDTYGFYEAEYTRLIAPFPTSPPEAPAIRGLGL